MVFHLSELDDEFLNVASKVPTNYMGEQVASGGASDTIDEDHIDSMLASLNTCLRQIAWIGGMFQW